VAIDQAVDQLEATVFAWDEITKPGLLDLKASIAGLINLGAGLSEEFPSSKLDSRTCRSPWARRRARKASPPTASRRRSPCSTSRDGAKRARSSLVNVLQRERRGHSPVTIEHGDRRREAVGGLAFRARRRAPMVSGTSGDPVCFR